MNNFKVLRASLAAGACMATLAFAVSATAQAAVDFNIPAGDLKAALEAYARQSPQPVVYRIDDLRGLRAGPVRGKVAPADALNRLLAGTALKVRRDESGLLAVVKEAPARATTTQEAAPLPLAQEEAVTVDEIVVTGSRLVRNDLTAASPVTVVGAEDIRASGSVTIENVLNQFPQLAGGRTSSVNLNGGAGVLTANLRSLGSKRTLVMVNGRRFIPADSEGAVDLAAIPDALVQRVDIMSGGASAVYGSDAIAGAVNFILKRDFQGLEIAYSHGRTSEDDGASNKLDVTFGANADDGRGNVVFAASYSDREAVMQSSRAFAAIPLDTVNGQLVPGGSSNVPGTRIGLSAAQRAQLVGVDLTASGPCDATTGIVFGEGGVPGPYCNPQSAYNYADYSYLLRPLERFQLSSIARYDLTDKIEAYAEGFFVNSRNFTMVAPDSITLSSPGAPTSTLLVPNYATHPLFSQSVRDFFVDNRALFDPDGDGTAAIVGASRRFNELGARESRYERASFGVTTGLKGDLALAGHDLKWDVFYQYQRNRMDSLRKGTVSSTRLSQALDAVVRPDGQVVCAVQAFNCVPVNVFGLDSIDPAARDFLAPDRAANEVFERQVFGGTLAGDLFELPAGPLSAALGFEYRDESFEFNPSAMDRGGEYANRSESPLAGQVDVTEFFGEVRVPILADLPLVHSLAIEAAARYSDYSSVGGVTTWKLGGEYEPTDWLRFRVAYNEAIRAPNISELFAPILVVPSSGEDPCVVSRNPTAAQKALCVAQGVSASDIDNFSQDQPYFDIITGGNTSLREETSKTFTAGFVLRAPWIEGLNLAVDYFDIQVDDAITSLNANQILNDCFTTLDQGSTTCRSIRRMSNGQIETLAGNLQNIGSMTVNGVDVQADYRFDMPDRFGLPGEGASMALNVMASWMFERSMNVLADQPAIDCAGRFGNGCSGLGVPGTPDFKLRAGANYVSGPLTVRLQAHMVGEMELYPGFSAAIQKTPSRIYTALSGSYDVNETVELFGGVENLFDEDPPIMGTFLVGDANTDVGLYDVIGRRFQMGVRMRF